MRFPIQVVSSTVISLLLCWVALRVAGRGEGEGMTAERLVAVVFGALGVEVLSYGLAGEGYVATATLCRTTAIVAASSALVVFTWRVFHPGRPWAAGLALVLSGLVAVSFIVPLVFQVDSPWAAVVWGVLRSAAYLWAFVECWRYRGVMRRRAALGLGDPVVANRLLLWSIWTGCAAVLPLVGVVMRLVYLVQGREDALWAASQEGAAVAPTGVIVTALVAILGVVGALWLSFFPPASYLRWVGARSVSGAEAA